MRPLVPTERFSSAAIAESAVGDQPALTANFCSAVHEKGFCKKKKNKTADNSLKKKKKSKGGPYLTRRSPFTGGCMCLVRQNLSQLRK
jgi:hypothetical protein